VHTVLKTLESCGAKLLMAIPGFFSPEDDRATALERMIAGMENLIEAAKAVEIGVCLEDFDDCTAPFSTIGGLNGFLERLPALGWAFDTGNFRYSEESETEAFQLLRNRIVHLHCKDRRFSPNRPNEEEKRTVGGKKMYPAAVGTGELPIETIVKELLRAGYQGWFAVEHFGSADQLSDIKKSAENLRKWNDDYRNRME
ncbi:MAG: sugar phosphate isomerase/epimerase, partial [Ruminiclostridium sp.]|nr:sugar phosphate isomerase/epimerase [Ruminiclostridium sp.]